MDYLVWAGILLSIGLALAMLEVFVPSGGLLGFLSLMSLLAAVIMAFRHGPWSGIGFLGAAVFAVPAGLILALQWWPKTPMGRRILLPLPTSDEVLPDSDRRRNLKSLVGKIGKAKSLMLPSGAVDVEGTTVDALSEGMAIEAGAWVKVVEVRGTRVVVRPTEQRPAPPEHDDTLDQSIESLGLDPVEDPLS
jgi:membrane-bound ClpP family serine protease